MNNTDTPTIPSNTTDTATTTDSMMQSTAGRKMRDNNNDTANTTTTTIGTNNTITTATTTTTTNNKANETKRTEQEKMLAGELYLAMEDPTLRHDRNIVKELCYQYNYHTNPTNYQRRSELLYQILPNLPKTNDTTTTTTTNNNNNPNQHEQNDDENQNQPQQDPNNIDITIEAQFYCDYGYNINFTKNCRVFYANHGVTILDCHSITFGHNVFIAPHVCISAATHPTSDPQLRLDGYELAAPIVIRDNVWIGANAFIGPGVTIGTNSVVGAGYVVIRNVPDNVIVAGVPAKIIRTINTNTTNTNNATATNSNSNSIITTTTTTSNE